MVLCGRELRMREKVSSSCCGFCVVVVVLFGGDLGVVCVVVSENCISGGCGVGDE